MKNSQSFDIINSSDRQKLLKTLKESFHANDELLCCIEYLGKSFVNKFQLNSCLLSFINEKKTNDATPSKPKRFFDANGIHRLLSVFVKKTRKENVYKVVNPKGFANHVTSIDLESKFKCFDNLCRRATDDRVNMGGHSYEHAINMLRSWLQTVHWVNDGLTAEKAINLKNCTKEEINRFARTIVTHLKPSTTLRESTALRNFWKRGYVKDKLDDLYKECRRPNATGGDKVHMIVGVPHEPWKNKGDQTEIVPVGNQGEWREHPNSGWISLSQMRRNLEIAHVLFDTRNVTTNNCKKSLVTVSLWKQAKERVSPMFRVNRRNGTCYNVVHKRGDWNNRNWLRRDVEEILGKNKLASFVVDWDWLKCVPQTENPGGKKGLKALECNHCGQKFFTHTLPGLRQFSMLHDEGSVYLPMHPWFYTMIILYEVQIHQHYVVDFQKNCNHVDEGHGEWSEGKSDRNHRNHMVQCNLFPTCDGFKKGVQRLEGKVGKNKNVTVAVRRLVDGFLQLGKDKFSAYQWIRLRPRVEDRISTMYITPPEKVKVEVNKTTTGSVWMVGLPFDNNANRIQTAEWLALSTSEKMCEKIWKKCQNGSQNQAAEIMFRLLYAGHKSFENINLLVLTFGFKKFERTSRAYPSVLRESQRMEKNKKKARRFVKSQHWNGDWNIPEFYEKIFSQWNRQIQTIVFHPVWHPCQDPGCDIDEREEIAIEIAEKYDEMYRKEFFDNFFRLVNECNILKMNGHVVMPFHPRILAGLFRIFPNNLNFLNYCDDIRTLSEVQDGWKSFLAEKEHSLPCGFDHNVYGSLGSTAFMEAIYREAQMMEVSPSDMEDFLHQQEINVTTKYIWMSAKDLYANLRNVAIRTNDEEDCDLLGLTENVANNSDNELNENETIMPGRIENIRLDCVEGEQFLKTCIEVEATEKGGGRNEMDLVINLDGDKEIMITNSEGVECRCTTVKLAEKNKDNEKVFVEYKWDATRNKYRKRHSTQKPENKNLHTQVTVTPGVGVTPDSPKKKRQYNFIRPRALAYGDGPQTKRRRTW